ncbi:MAG: hypothetical protein EOM17_08020 [Synergistales bacterium]|nr:hypothetical protein [Synergistales bacterium]
MRKTFNPSPGPWRICTEESRADWEIVVDARGHIVANVNTESGPDIPPAVSTKMPAKANAHLIAAAPDLLRELERLENQSGLPLERDDPARVAARTAIRKARGEE